MRDSRLRILTRSHRIRRALEKVWAKLPSDARQSVASCVEKVCADREWWYLPGTIDKVNPESAGLYPWAQTDEANRRTAVITFSLPVCRLFSDRALIGIVAHEFAHACRAAAHGGNLNARGEPVWHEKMVRQVQAEERHADRIATEWGFGAHIKALRQERQTKVSGLIEARERQIVRRLRQRDERDRQVWEQRIREPQRQAHRPQ